MKQIMKGLLNGAIFVLGVLMIIGLAEGTRRQQEKLPVPCKCCKCTSDSHCLDECCLMR